jgi:hypothetical protein
LLPSRHYGQAFVSLNWFALLKKADPNCACGERGPEGCTIRAASCASDLEDDFFRIRWTNPPISELNVAGVLGVTGVLGERYVAFDGELEYGGILSEYVGGPDLAI